MSGQKYARMSGNIVTEVFDMWDGPPIEKYFTAELVAAFHPCGDEVKPGWLWDQPSETYSPPETSHD